MTNRRWDGPTVRMTLACSKWRFTQIRQWSPQLLKSKPSTLSAWPGGTQGKVTVIRGHDPWTRTVSSGHFLPAWQKADIKRGLDESCPRASWLRWIWTHGAVWWDLSEDMGRLFLHHYGAEMVMYLFPCSQQITEPNQYIQWLHISSLKGLVPVLPCCIGFIYKSLLGMDVSIIHWAK